MWERVQWIGIPKEEYRNKKIDRHDLNGRFVYYRHTFTLQEAGKCVVNISANSRYRLWINEEPVLSGPCRGDAWYTYYDTVDISSKLKIGKNVMAVQVLLFDENQVINGADDRAPLYSVISHFPEHLLVVEGSILTENGKCMHTLSTGESNWNVCLDGKICLSKINEKNEFMGAMSENIDCNRTDLGWKKIDFCQDKWLTAENRIAAKTSEFNGMVGLMDKLHLYERPIPLLSEEKPIELQEIQCEQEEDGKWVPAETRKENGDYRIAANKKIRILFSADYLLNGYLGFKFDQGAGSKITIYCFEKFYHKEQKVRRDDFINGEMFQAPQTDSITLNGESINYEPFWYRTLRFMILEIETKNQELLVSAPVIRKMGYPLNPQFVFQTENPKMQRLWDMCVRTLENCMTDAYMDCPFWEQMQYAMDTRLEALFTYACEGDIRLVKKALWDFHCSKLPCGLIQGKAPSSFPQVISTFSLHYIFMICEYLKETGDVEEVRQYLGDIDDILGYYDRHREDTYGLVGNIGYWPFVDWQDAWAAHGGIPNAVDYGPSTIINLMYAYALEQGACVMDKLNRSGMAKEYRKRKEEITTRIQMLCFDEERGLYKEGPALKEYSQHAQSWAVLLEMCDERKAKNVMKASFEEDVIPCGFSTSYELFRACEKAGVYELTFSSLKRWIDLLDEHCTTCPETPDYSSRSECHAWSALPMYELRYCYDKMKELIRE